VNKVVSIKQAISADLSLRSRADAFFDSIEELDVRDIVIDFSEVRSISRSFAHQYLEKKRLSKKAIRESHMPAHVAKMFDVVQNPSSRKDLLVDSDAMPLI